jgi:hypothetical protein
MNLYRQLIPLTLSRPKLREALGPVLKRAGLSTLDVAIFDFVRNQFQKEMTSSFETACDYATSITKKEPGYLEGHISQIQWKLKFDIVHRGDGYDIETMLHIGKSFQDAQFHKWETGQHESLETLFTQINQKLAEHVR